MAVPSKVQVLEGGIVFASIASMVRGVFTAVKLHVSVFKQVLFFAP